MRALIAFVAMWGSAALADNKGYIVVYDGYGTSSGFVLGGRVLEDKGERAPVKAASSLDNIVNNFKALESDEVRGADVAVNVAGHIFSATSDEDGVFRVQVKDLPEGERLPQGAVPVHVEVTKPGNVKAEGNGIVNIADGPFIALISDMDDTVVKTYVTDKKRMLGAVLLKNAKQSEPVEGAAANYAKARDAGVKMFFYVSGSPQNFYRRIHGFLDENKFPIGPLVLKNIGEDNLLEQKSYKIDRIEKLFAALPQMRVILVGDSGERDPEVYAEIKKRYPERVVGVVIRTMTRSDVRPERFAGMKVVDDKYAADDVIAGLLPPAPPP